MRFSEMLKGRVVMIAPHPDDEVIGAGGQFPDLQDPWFLHVTDGAPRNMQDARAYGFVRPEDYARARHQELLAALDLAGISEDRAIALRFIDQEAAFHLSELTVALMDLIRKLAPDVILTPAYEGGHPDHDSTAFAVHRARHMLAEGGASPLLVEYALYHAGEKGVQTGTFLPWPGYEPEEVLLTPSCRELKSRMFDCFLTQRIVLQGFSTEYETFRLAPPYDFLAPPHGGSLHYDQFSWGVTGAEWRELVRQATTVGGERP